MSQQYPKLDSAKSNFVFTRMGSMISIIDAQKDGDGIWWCQCRYDDGDVREWSWADLRHDEGINGIVAIIERVTSFNFTDLEQVAIERAVAKPDKRIRAYAGCHFIYHNNILYRVDGQNGRKNWHVFKYDQHAKSPALLKSDAKIAANGNSFESLKKANAWVVLTQ